ncbi:MAG TPA: hypothetical protein PKC40_06545 [Saprospiraceae bacterium]|nr:hypothetical protein [Saprospiraceae bacterium]
MKIVGDIPHPFLKITIFKWNEKFSVKFEAGVLEQTYKFRDGEGVDNLNDVLSVVDETFIESVAARMTEMQQIRQAALLRFAPAAEDEFEEII